MSNAKSCDCNKGRTPCTCKDVYVPSEQEAQEALADAEVMNRNMRQFGTIDAPVLAQRPVTNLSFNMLREANVKRCEESFFPLDSKDGPWWGNAMAGECGEACNFVKKIDRDGLTSERVHGLAKELADLVTYADLLAARFGINLGEAVVSKFNEITDRVGGTIRLVDSGFPEMPSGGPEVLAWVHPHRGLDWRVERTRVAPKTELVDRAHLTPLLVENDDLRHQCGGMEMEINDLKQEMTNGLEAWQKGREGMRAERDHWLEKYKSLSKIAEVVCSGFAQEQGHAINEMRDFIKSRDNEKLETEARLKRVAGLFAKNVPAFGAMVSEDLLVPRGLKADADQLGEILDDESLAELAELERRDSKLETMRRKNNELNETEARLKTLLRRVIDSSVLSFEKNAPEGLESLEADICAELKPS